MAPRRRARWARCLPTVALVAVKEEAILDTLAAADPWANEYAANVAAVGACRQRLVDEGIDLDLYDTLASVADMEVLRETFEVEQWNLNEQVTVDVPTLVFGGTLDPVTPLTESRAQAEAIPDARFVAVPRGGHGVSGTNECTKEVRTTFWRDPAADVPACAGALEPTAFALAG